MEQQGNDTDGRKLNYPGRKFSYWQKTDVKVICDSTSYKNVQIKIVANMYPKTYHKAMKFWVVLMVILY